MSERTKILLIEDHPIVRDGCLRILARRPDFEPFEASSAQAGLDANRALRPAVIILDLELPDQGGLEVIPELLRDNPGTRIVIFTMYEAASFVTRALERGARGYVTKNDDPNAILQAIDKALAGAVYLGQSVAQNLALANFEPVEDPLRVLSEREKQVVTLLGEGKNLSEISAALAIGYKTAANIVSAVKQKLGIGTSPALIKFAVELRGRG
ncbi:two component transcriptional regulator, LuxR family [Methylocella silvestris BL2]|uniref:Two component transcriptional regulator, LuxR family n=1 Tax=Methylocella silvestris (strain DSM 15510 / CIP 108128 / LMG 27833 / NCIMB 13906 / BL2) TaxID=395965 RepID=B8EMN2_METSB|nr:response regulator transcription factor [Methylocella silvestris]ACK52711.1 two component transcriptional regulator, LuxR family [Methylocella silvestris BL2]